MFTSVLPEIAKTTATTTAAGGGGGPSKRVASILEDSDEQPAAPSASALTRHKSTKFLAAAAAGLQRSTRQLSLRKGVFQAAVKPDVPPHLLKFLQKTPEQQQRLNAVKVILADEPSARNEMSLDVVYDWMLQNCKQVSACVSCIGHPARFGAS